MKARRKSDGEIIEVEAAVYNLKNGKPYHKCLSDGHHYPASDLDFKLDADTVIQGWVGRDQDGNLPLFVGSKPYKPEGMDYWSVPHGRSLEYLNLNPALFPDLTWESEPLEVELLIKRKKNG